jgi:hypothetical protein
MTLTQKIEILIQSKREGAYWDFKKESYSNNSDLLHDILCMANSVTKCDKYIIMGVKDPIYNCEIIGIDTSSQNRKTQNQYIDYLRNLKFASDKRPEIELRSITLEQNQVDVLIIFDRPIKPYYLSADKDGLKANYIYSRNGDTNTPKNKSTDELSIEKMWSERFGIDIRPSDRFISLLSKTNEWDLDPGNKKEGYCKSAPEYTIQFSKLREGWEPYSHYFPNKKTHFGTAKFKYFSTVLFECGYVFLDEYRIPLGIPEIGYITLCKNDYYYYYFNKNSINYKLSMLLGIKLLSRFKPQYMPFIIYENKEEQEEFEKHLVENELEIIGENADPVDESRLKRIQEDGDGSGVDVLVMGKIIRWFYNWKEP